MVRVGTLKGFELEGTSGVERVVLGSARTQRELPQYEMACRVIAVFIASLGRCSQSAKTRTAHEGTSQHHQPQRHTPYDPNRLSVSRELVKIGPLFLSRAESWLVGQHSRSVSLSFHFGVGEVIAARENGFKVTLPDILYAVASLTHLPPFKTLGTVHKTARMHKAIITTLAL